MVGPGTGIAPFRAFIEERAEAGNEGGSWLFFGDQKYHFDFAHFYVCGDATRMANDVHEALIEVVQSQGGKSLEDATAYVDQLKKDKRYQRDVY